MNISQLIDKKAYPIDNANSSEGLELINRGQTQLESTGVLTLLDFCSIGRLTGVSLS